MKIRNGFVSNSSSSSFICDVCGQDVSGWDMSLSEAEMYECENGHIFCEHHALSYESKKQFCIGLITSKIESYTKRMNDSEDTIGTGYGSKKYYENYLITEQEKLKEVEESDEDYDYDDLMESYDYRYEFPSKYCPICQMEHVTDSDMVSFLFKKFNLSKEDVKNEIKSTFKNYEDFKTYKK